MLIYLLRHGDAPYNALEGGRSLSPEGKKDIQRVLLQHRAELSELALIVCSPVLRARQTMRVFVESLNYRGSLLFEDILMPESSVVAVENRVDSLAEAPILLLSHQPLIGKILEYLTDRSGLGWSMTTSSLACLETTAFSRGCAELKWLTNP
ncbi:SixA phosphatase family protein [Porticoccus sp.]|uniref:SixA phosphatase family protein n=1 Tax=Porticoccus sp. TaxID=2024853 RepID=UPI003F695C16